MLLSSNFPIEPISTKKNGKLHFSQEKEVNNIFPSDKNEIMKSAYSEDYTLKSPTERAMPIKPSNQLILSEDIFIALTTYGEEYTAKQVEKTLSLKNCAPYSPSSDKQSFTTSYSTDFNEKMIDRVKMIKPQNILNNPVESTENHLTNYQIEFVKKEPEKNTNFQPKHTYKQSEQCEKYQSNYQIEFPAVPLFPRESFKPIVLYEKPSVSVETNSSYKLEFTSSQSLSPTRNFRPDNSFQTPDIPFHKSTSYQEDFLYSKDNIGKLLNCKPKSEYIYNTEPFDGATTYLYDFQRSNTTLEKTSSFKPKSNYVLPTESLDAQSTYQTEFQSIKDFSRVDCIRPVSENPLPLDKYHSKPNDDCKQNMNSGKLFVCKSHPLK